MLKRIFHSITVLFSVLAITWIIVGSTVEFHQRYVYHNHINIVGAHFLKLKEHEKHFKVSAIDLGFQMDPGFTDAALNDNSEIANLNLSKRNTFSCYLYDLTTPEYLIHLSLRGPPVAQDYLTSYFKFDFVHIKFRC